MKASIEINSNNKILGIILYILNYFKSLYFILFRPNKTISGLVCNKNVSYKVKPEVFLIINVILTYLIFEVPYGEDKLYQKFTWIITRFSSLFIYSTVILKYIFGILIFLIILSVFLKPYKINSFTYKIYYPICYASAVFLPSVLLKNLLFKIGLIPVMMNMMSVFSGITPKITGFGILKSLMFPVGAIFCVWWWGYLIYIGFRNTIPLPSKKLRGIIFKSVILFLILQNVLFIIRFTIDMSPVFKAVVSMAKTEEVISEKPTNYLKAAMLTESVSNCEELGPYYQYRAKIRAVAYKLSTLLVDREIIENVSKEVLPKIKNYDYKNAELILFNFLEKASKDISNPRRPTYLELLDELKEAVRYHNSPNYSESGYIVFYYSKDLIPVLLFP